MRGGDPLGREPERPGALLVIGAHREELAFGEAVARRLAGPGGSPGLEVLRIAEGITGRRPRPDQRYRYELQHRALYRQIRERAGFHRLLIDLHRGDDDGGPCADVICADDLFLSRVSAGAGSLPGDAGLRLRPVHLGPGSPGAPVQGARTVIPEDVWASQRFLFVELEVYLAAPGAGSPPDWAFAAALIAHLVRCAPGH